MICNVDQFFANTSSYYLSILAETLLIGHRLLTIAFQEWLFHYLKFFQTIKNTMVPLKKLFQEPKNQWFSYFPIYIIE